MGPTVERTYDRAGTYNEILTVTCANGESDVDFAIVTVADRRDPARPVPGIHAVYFPTSGLRAGDPIEFQVRARRTIEGVDRWDFGDGSPGQTVRSNVDPDQHAHVGYARAIHRFRKPGRYIVSVARTTSFGNAVDRLVVDVE